MRKVHNFREKRFSWKHLICLDLTHTVTTVLFWMTLFFRLSLRPNYNSVRWLTLGVGCYIASRWTNYFLFAFLAPSETRSVDCIWNKNSGEITVPISHVFCAGGLGCWGLCWISPQCFGHDAGMRVDECPFTSPYFVTICLQVFVLLFTVDIIFWSWLLLVCT